MTSDSTIHINVTNSLLHSIISFNHKMPKSLSTSALKNTISVPLTH